MTGAQPDPSLTQAGPAWTVGSSVADSVFDSGYGERKALRAEMCPKLI